jgi:hypothetical protein
MQKDIYDIHKHFECSPIIYSNLKNIIWNKERKFASCFPKEHLISMIQLYNKQYPDKINLENILKYNKKDIHYKLWKELYNKFYNQCKDDEICWLKQPSNKLLPNKEDIYQYFFKPSMPKGNNGKYKNVWLSNYDIENVMKQYEGIFPHFKFLGPFPIDYMKYGFYKLDNNLINNLLKKGITQIGIIFNTGTLKSGGKHWVTLFLNFKNKDYKNSYTIEYFDSVGNPPAKEINNFLNEIKKTFCNQNDCIPLHLHIKQLEHQRGNSECGVYALYFIVERLKGRSYIDIQSQLTPDDVMEQFRSKFFRK